MRIALSGRPGAGKNAVADIISKLTGARQYSFAEALREEVAEVVLYGGPIPRDLLRRALGNWALAKLVYHLLRCRDALIDPWAKPTHPWMRKVLQLWGTDYRRAQDSGYWVKRVHIHPGPAVITDRRFANEQLPGFLTVYVWRSSLEALAYSHASEQQLRHFDCGRAITNDGTLEDLEVAVRQLLLSEGLLSE